MPPVPATVEIPWSLISAIAGGVLSVFGAVLLVMVKRMLKTDQKRQEERFESLKKEMTTAIESARVRYEDFKEQATQRFADYKETVDNSLQTAAEHVDGKLQTNAEYVVQLEERFGSYFKAHERLRDKWDEFLREYLKIDNTRGAKVDALFRITDQMQDVLKELRPALNNKVEEMISHTISELKLYIRERVQDEVRKEASDA